MPCGVDKAKELGIGRLGWDLNAQEAVTAQVIGHEHGRCAAPPDVVVGCLRTLAH